GPRAGRRRLRDRGRAFDGRKVGVDARGEGPRRNRHGARHRYRHGSEVKTGPLAMRAARRKLGRALAMGVAAAILAADPSARAAANAEPAPGAAVEELLALVRNFNPALAAAALDREQAVAKIYPAGALDDPMLTLGRD